MIATRLTPTQARQVAELLVQRGERRDLPEALLVGTGILSELDAQQRAGLDERDLVVSVGSTQPTAEDACRELFEQEGTHCGACADCEAFIENAALIGVPDDYWRHGTGY